MEPECIFRNEMNDNCRESKELSDMSGYDEYINALLLTMVSAETKKKKNRSLINYKFQLLYCHF